MRSSETSPVGPPAREVSDKLRRRTLAVLALATTIASTGGAAGGTAGALLGAEFTGSEAGAGLPVGLLVLGQAAAALLVSARTARVGRGRGLALGYVLGAVGAVLVIAAAVAGNLIALLLGSTMLGAGNAAIFLTRYAAAEVGGGSARGRALGAVFFATALGGVASPGILGPSGELASMTGLPPLTGLYLFSVACFATSASLLAAASNPGIPFLGRGAMLLGPRVGAAGRSRVSTTELASGLRAPAARAALIVLAATNLVMVAVMTIAPVHLTAHGHGLDLVGIIIGAHVAGMFAPSPISGWATDRIGPVPVAASGVSLLAAVGIAGALVDQDSVFWMTIVLAMLGIGWNFGVVGASALLADSVPAVLRPHVEGLGEVSMGLAAGAGAPAAGLIVALGGFATLSLFGAAVAIAAASLSLALVRRAS